MIRISITIAATMPFGSVAYKAKLNDKGEREIWLEPHILNKLRLLRGPGECCSDVILRLAEPVEANRVAQELQALLPQGALGQQLRPMEGRVRGGLLRQRLNVQLPNMDARKDR